MLDDVVGRSESLVDIAEADAAAIVALVDEIIGAVLLEVRRRHRFLDVEDGGKILVVDDDAAGAFECGLRRLGEHRADLLAHEQHAVLRQHRLVVGPDADQLEDRVPVVGHVLVGEDAHHARHLQRRLDVDALDQRVMAARAHHLQVQHVGEADVLVELGAAGDVAARVGALHALADDGEVGVAFPGKEAPVDLFHESLLQAASARWLACMRAAASSTASMIAS